jgi:RNase adapter protein RapZ
VKPRRRGRQGPRLLAITGLSGSGKTHVSRALEDIGWFCVDNLPTPLILPFGELIGSSEPLRHSALVVDMRGPDFVREFPRALRALGRKGLAASVLFLEASDEALLRRFSETRRPHPLAVNDPVIEGIRQEREGLRPIRKLADQIVDTSDLTVHELRDHVREHYHLRPTAGMVVQVVSFGYKYGPPPDADLVFDARFLPNPNFVPALKRLTGQHPAVVRFMRRQPETDAFLRRLRSFLRYMLPRYVREGKSHLTIGIGCTGGRHRSVMIAGALGQSLRGPGHVVRVRHRDARL